MSVHIGKKYHVCLDLAGLDRAAHLRLFPVASQNLVHPKAVSRFARDRHLGEARASDGGLRTATTIGRRLLRACWREGFELRVPVILVASNLAEKKKRPNPFEPGP
jgi:hypothetical protein